MPTFRSLRAPTALVTFLFCCPLQASNLKPEAEAEAEAASAAHAGQIHACFEPKGIVAMSTAHAYAVDVDAEGGRFRVTIDGRCAPLAPTEPMQLAGEGQFCGDGNDVLITATQVCAATVVERLPEPVKCFSINAVRSYVGMSGNLIEVTLRGGERRRMELENSCAQLDRFDSVNFVSGSGNGKICGHPRDSVYGSFTESAAGNSMGGGFARQLSANDFRECRITKLLPPEPRRNE